jgi:hypothetical protein
MTDFVYILQVDFDTPLMAQTARMTFTDRSEAEKFREDGERLGYKVIHLNAYPAYTAEKAMRVIKEEKEFHRRIAAQRLDDEIKSMI